MPLKSESEGKFGKAGEEKEAKEGEGERGEGKEESENMELAQVLQSQELLLKRKDSQEDQRPMDQVSLPDLHEKEEKKRKKERKKKEEKEMEEVKGKTKKWTWNEMNIGENKQQKQEEPSLLAILRLFFFSGKDCDVENAQGVQVGVKWKYLSSEKNPAFLNSVLRLCCHTWTKSFVSCLSLSGPDLS